MKRILCAAFGATLAAAAFGAMPAHAQDYRGQYWYHKYFGPTETRAYRSEGREALPRGELQARAYDQGFYNAHHLRHAADKPEIYALAHEAEFDNEVVIAIDARSGEVIDAVVLPH